MALDRALEQTTSPEQSISIDLDIVLATGLLYRDIIQVVSGANEDPNGQVIPQIQERMVREKPKVQQAYRIALHDVRKGLLKNEHTLQHFQTENSIAEPKVAMLRCLIESLKLNLSNGMLTRNIEGVLESQTDLDSITLQTPIPGLYELHLPKHIFQKLTNTGADGPSASRIEVVLPNKENFSFLAIPIEESNSAENETENKEVYKHELHHALWGALLDSGTRVVTAPSQETMKQDVEELKGKLKAEGSFNPFSIPRSLEVDVLTGFMNFRNELSAYILSFSISRLPPQEQVGRMMTYTENKMVNSIAGDVLQEIRKAIDEIQEKTQLPNPQLLFIYAAMHAKNFSELRQMTSEIKRKALESHVA